MKKKKRNTVPKLFDVVHWTQMTYQHKNTDINLTDGCRVNRSGFESCQSIELKDSMGSDSSSMEAAWKQSAASLILPSCLLSNPKQCQAMRLVGSIRSASDSALLAAQKNFGPNLWIMPPIKILHGTWFGSSSIPLIVARRASSFSPRPSNKTPAKPHSKIWKKLDAI